ncbi:hypothetical protein P4H94_00770 [Paenibacillus macerans]|uniref:Uncharacterized protein n=1 Tax=Paenibacillus macerans TaxID=44252 RepID=A0A090ZCE2_PAEMA|nr:DUF6756 family protein [Paenibacillus macerans]KFN08312.1 hypothetical protein DJ90_1550 [Paenibacillus macerans]MBS5913824.1 hypothetical protein [Paenibacillus macerans]MCY7557145.1 hypothetical protein [Paenibacillus macerans]MEC0135433.1 hypothetical protein [Paenibacillus macerans]MEC0152462.1 hypothetical protein [Paenibacillus macerans]
MDTLSIRDEIEVLLKQFPEYRPHFCEVGKYDWEQIKNKVEERFVQKKHYKYDLHWAWLRFKEPQYAASFVKAI